MARARAFVCGLLEQHQLSGLVEELRMVVSELATNAVLHAETPFSVSLGEVDGEVIMAVRDGCARLPGPCLPGGSLTHGRGLQLVASLSSSWGATADPEGGKTVWARFVVSPMVDVPALARHAAVSS